MQEQLTPSLWEMGSAEWLELTAFWILALIVLGLLGARILRQPDGGTDNRVWVQHGWRQWPEVRLVILALPLELLWEIAHFPLYDVWHQNDWSYILYGLAHCTLGDLLILLVIYELIALLARDRHWYLAANGIMSKGLLFTSLGVVYTIFSEIMNVRIKGTWGYTDMMPIIPVVDIGGTPFLQWVLIPPVLLWLMRSTVPLR